MDPETVHVGICPKNLFLPCFHETFASPIDQRATYRFSFHRIHDYFAVQETAYLSYLQNKWDMTDLVLNLFPQAQHAQNRQFLTPFFYQAEHYQLHFFNIWSFTLIDKISLQRDYFSKIPLRSR